MKDTTSHCLECQAQACLSNIVVETMRHHDKGRLVLSFCVLALFSFRNYVHIQGLVCFSSGLSICPASDLRVDTGASSSSVLIIDIQLIAA